MLNIEFLKLIKRKFNYFYILLTLIFIYFLMLKSNNIVSYLDVDISVYIYDYLLKWVLFSLLFLSIINVIFSYRVDFTQKTFVLIKYSKITNFKFVFSKIIVNFLYFSFIYLFYIIFVYMYYYLKKVLFIADILNQNSIFYYVLSILSILFVICVTFFIVSLFNNTNLAISLSLFWFLSSKFIFKYLDSVNSLFNNLKYSPLQILNEVFFTISSDISLYYFKLNSLLIVLSILFLMFISLLINKVKIM